MLERKGNVFFGKGSLLGHDPKSLELEAYNKASFQLNIIYSFWFAGVMLGYIVVFLLLLVFGPYLEMFRGYS